MFLPRPPERQTTTLGARSLQSGPESQGCALARGTGGFWPWALRIREPWEEARYNAGDRPGPSRMMRVMGPEGL